MENDFHYIKKYFDYSKNGDSFFQVLSDDVAFDLNVDMLFSELDNTCSKIGKQYFYSLFRNIEPKNRTYLQKYVDHFEQNKDKKDLTVKELSSINEHSDFGIIDLIAEDIHPNQNYFKYAQVSTLATILILICTFFAPKILLLYIPIYLGNFYFHYANKNYVEHYNQIMSRLYKTINIAERLSNGNNFSNDFNDIHLKQLKRSIRFINFERSLAKNEFLLPLWIVIENVKILFNVEIFSFRNRVQKLNKSRGELIKLFKYIGIIDSAIAIINIKRTTPTCAPQFLENKVLLINNIYHPLIENCVKNSIKINHKSAVITGSNMSGKTSFMRYFAINAIFAQNFNFCFADEYIAPTVQIFTSISVHDDIGSNKSYYLEEVLRIKNFLEDRDSFSLILIDEIFKGTNTKERIAISKSVLNTLNSEKNIVLVTTHDIEIANFLSENNYDQYFFDEEIIDGQLHFPYQIMSGINKKTNAIEILKMADYPEKVIKSAINFVEID